jgi:Holliday junction resolvase RusA-like endonuclease
VLAYRDWCDAIRKAAGITQKVRLAAPAVIYIDCYFTRPRGSGLAGTPYTKKPDGDNILKGVCDALFLNDQMVCEHHIARYYTTMDTHTVVNIAEWHP